MLLPALSLGSINALLGRFEQQIQCGHSLTSNEAVHGHGEVLVHRCVRVHVFVSWYGVVLYTSAFLRA